MAKLVRELPWLIIDDGIERRGVGESVGAGFGRAGLDTVSEPWLAVL